MSARLPSQERLEQIVQHILEVAVDLGATAAEAGVSCDQGLSVTVRMGEVETLEYHRDQGLGVSVYFGHRKGSASTSDLSEAAVRETVQAACDIARYTGEDACAGLAPADRMAREIPDLDLYHPWALTAEEGIDIARRCEDIARAQDPRIHNSEGATLSTHEGLRVYGNTHGFLGGYPSTRHSLSCSVLAEQDGQMQRDYWYTVARAPEDLQSPEDVGRIAAERTVHRLGARRIATCQAPVLFAPEVATGLFRSFVAAIRGGNLYRRSSFLLDKLGEPIFPAFLHIEEQPHLPRGLGSAPFDSEGVATQRRALVEGGVLRGYVLDSYSACRLGMETTGNAGGVHNLRVQPGEEDLPALLRRMGTGLLVTELMGQGVNLVTGDYSRGAAGFWIENGEVAHPVHEITIAGNLARMFLDIEAVGADVDTRGNIHTGSVLVREMTIAGD
ncbi:MAG: metalloprotease PmbA [Gammaproteobacteria bacterium]|nr:MAG: metalloprotease PmbA [Gammaproteobacteria bacterium]